MKILLSVALSLTIHYVKRFKIQDKIRNLKFDCALTQLGLYVKIYLLIRRIL